MVTIMPETALPVRAEDAIGEIEDALAGALELVSAVGALHPGIEVSFSVEAGCLAADIRLTADTRHLLPRLARHFSSPGWCMPAPGVARAVSTMAGGRVSVTVTGPGPDPEVTAAMKATTATADAAVWLDPELRAAFDANRAAEITGGRAA
ncbi:hypothetical protein [Streptomyces sp. NPDC021096]|uniref:hypothetical protein n=1 Tax=Streptomyces sp. NPDC021096 TaxID=3154792 RepID=UPI0033D44783